MHLRRDGDAVIELYMGSVGAAYKRDDAIPDFGRWVRGEFVRERSLMISNQNTSAMLLWAVVKMHICKILAWWCGVQSADSTRLATGYGNIARSLGIRVHPRPAIHLPI